MKSSNPKEKSKIEINVNGTQVTEKLQIRFQLISCRNRATSSLTNTLYQYYSFYVC